MPFLFFVAYRETFAAFGAAAREHGTSVLRAHSFSEAVRGFAFAIMRLKSSFHDLLLEVAKILSYIEKF
jgi:hypothetical protein